MQYKKLIFNDGRTIQQIFPEPGEEVWTSPPVPEHKKYLPLSQYELIQLCQSAGGMTDAMLVSAKSDAALASLWIKFGFVQSFERDHPDVKTGLDAFAAAGYLPNGTQAVLDGWAHEVIPAVPGVPFMAQFGDPSTYTITDPDPEFLEMVAANEAAAAAQTQPSA